MRNLILLLVSLFLCTSMVSAQEPYTYKSQFGSKGTGDGLLNFVGGLAVVENGDILVGNEDFSNSASGIQIFDKNHVFKGHFGSHGSGDGQFRSPYGIVIADNGDVLVVDANNRNVQIFDENYVFKSKFGSSGNGDGQFNFHFSLALAPNGDILVADSGNDRVQIFDSNGVYKSQFGSSGNGDGQFDNPADIFILDNGDIYVTDRSNNRVQLFDSNGVYKSQFGSFGTGDGEFNWPNGITIDSNGNIFVTEFFGNRVQVFDSNWNYINQFGSSGTGDGEFDKPFKIILAPNGDILVGDGLNGRVQVFHADPCAGTEFIFDIENAQLTTDNGVDGMNVFRVDVCGGNPNYSLELSSTPSNIFAMVDQFYKSPNCRSIRVTYGDHAEWVVRVVDTNDCSGEISYLDVAADGQMSIVGFASTNESKAGSSDGTASVVVVGGNDPYGVYTYEWTGATTSITVTDGSDGNTQTGLPSGIYTVVVTDAANNSQTITGVVRQNRWRGRGRRGGVGKTALTEGGEMFLTVAPNPFADYSTIQFQTPIAENVSIDVFSMNGQQVANLFEGQSNAESIQSVTFDRGYLQSGTYLVRLVTESGVVQHQKVVVM